MDEKPIENFFVTKLKFKKDPKALSAGQKNADTSLSQCDKMPIVAQRNNQDICQLVDKAWEKWEKLKFKGPKDIDCLDIDLYQ